MENTEIVPENDDVASKYGGCYGSDDRYTIKMDQNLHTDCIDYTCSQCGQSLSVPRVYWMETLITPEYFYNALVVRHLPCNGKPLQTDSAYLDAVNKVNAYNIDVMKHLKLVQ